MKKSDENQKLQLLCAVLRKEAVAPAQEEAARLLEQAKEEEKRILEVAHTEAASILETAQIKVKSLREEARFHLQVMGQHFLEHLRQKIEKDFFSPALQTLLEEKLRSGKSVNHLVEVIAKSIESLGLERAVVLELPDGIELTQLVKESIEKIMKNSSKHSIEFCGVALRCRFVKEGWSLDLDAESLAEMFWPMVQPSIRAHVFKEK